MVRNWTGRSLLVLALLWMWSGAAVAAPDKKREPPVACKQVSAKKSKSAKADDEDDDNGDDDDGDDEGVRFNLAGACAKLTGGVSYTYQQASKTAAGLPVIVNPNGTLSNSSFSNSISANIGLETRRQTNLGEFKTTLSAEWSKATDDGTQNGTADISGWSVGLGGLTLGYTGTLMSFWEGDFISTANAPGRSANTIVYEHKIDARNTVSAGLESNLPTTPQDDPGAKDIDFSDPVYTARWRYETDPLTVHASGLVRQVDFSNSPLLPLFPDTATVRTGWAASLGVKVPASFIAADDEFMAQATYAVDASAYLGISTDLTMYQNTVRSLGPTTGWSAVASFHHVWSEQFESNVYGSYVTLQADLLLARPEAQTFRSGINLYWKPVDKLKFGVEFGYVDVTLDPQGVHGIFDGGGGGAYTGYLSVSAEL
ncbi:MAG TPA: porin [Pseudolabrys sp.]